jgi:hypothetical protein
LPMRSFKQFIPGRNDEGNVVAVLIHHGPGSPRRGAMFFAEELSGAINAIAARASSFKAIKFRPGIPLNSTSSPFEYSQASAVLSARINVFSLIR